MSKKNTLSNSNISSNNEDKCYVNNRTAFIFIQVPLIWTWEKSAAPHTAVFEETHNRQCFWTSLKVITLKGWLHNNQETPCSAHFRIVLPSTANIFEYPSLPCCLKHNHSLPRACTSRGSQTTIFSPTSTQDTLQNQHSCIRTIWELHP